MHGNSHGNSPSVLWFCLPPLGINPGETTKTITIEVKGNSKKEDG